MKIQEYNSKVRKYVEQFHNFNGKDNPNRIHFSFIDEDIPINSFLVVAGRPRTAKTSFVLDFIARNSLLPIPENEVFYNEVPPRKGLVYFIGQKEDSILRRWYSIVNQYQIQEKNYTQFDYYLQDDYEKRIDKSEINIFFLRNTNEIIEQITEDIKDEYPDYIAIDGIDTSYWDIVDEDLRIEKRERLYIDLLEIQTRIQRTLLISRNIENNEDYGHTYSTFNMACLQSNVIETKADIVVILYRPDQYDIDVDAMGNSLKGIVEVKVVINRYGKDRKQLNWDISSGIPIKGSVKNFE